MAANRNKHWTVTATIFSLNWLQWSRPKIRRSRLFVDYLLKFVLLNSTAIPAISPHFLSEVVFRGTLKLLVRSSGPLWRSCQVRVEGSYFSYLCWFNVILELLLRYTYFTTKLSWRPLVSSSSSGPHFQDLASLGLTIVFVTHLSILFRPDSKQTPFCRIALYPFCFSNFKETVFTIELRLPPLFTSTAKDDDPKHTSFGIYLQYLQVLKNCPRLVPMENYRSYQCLTLGTLCTWLKLTRPQGVVESTARLPAIISEFLCCSCSTSPMVRGTQIHRQTRVHLRRVSQLGPCELYHVRSLLSIDISLRRIRP